MNKRSILAILALSSMAMGGPAEEPKMYYTDTSHGRSLRKSGDSIEWRSVKRPVWPSFELESLAVTGSVWGYSGVFRGHHTD